MLAHLLSACLLPALLWLGFRWFTRTAPSQETEAKEIRRQRRICPLVNLYYIRVLALVLGTVTALHGTALHRTALLSTTALDCIGLHGTARQGKARQQLRTIFPPTLVNPEIDQSLRLLRRPEETAFRP